MDCDATLITIQKISWNIHFAHDITNRQPFIQFVVQDDRQSVRR